MPVSIDPQHVERGSRRPVLLLSVLVGLLPISCEQGNTSLPPAATKGRLDHINGDMVLHLEGTPEEMGEQHGRLLKDQVKRVVADIIESTLQNDADLLRGAMRMEPFLPDAFRRELHALAKAAGVEYDRLVALQLFGDVNRGRFCTFYAVYDEATRTGEPIIGRNMDYWDSGVSQYAAVIIHFTPDEGLPFFTVSWAGIINGWTAMNEKGIVAANNTAYGTLDNSLDGLSTCFMLRKIVQYSGTVEEGIETIKTTPRACGTSMLIAGGHPPQAVAVEYDHKAVAVRRAKRSVVIADNDFCKLHCTTPRPRNPDGTSRRDILWKLIKKHYGKIDRSMNFAAADGVPITSMNLHSALLFPRDLSFRLAMGQVPAFRQPYRHFKMAPEGIVSNE